jgi:hypothetical protein
MYAVEDVFMKIFILICLTFLCGCTLTEGTISPTDIRTPTDSASETQIVLPIKSPTPAATLAVTMNIAASLTSGEYLVDFSDTGISGLDQPEVYSVEGEQVLLLPSIHGGTFSPDLRYLDQLDTSSVIDLITGQVISIVGVQNCGSPTWSSDSQRMIADCIGLDGDFNLYLITLADRSAKRITNCDGRLCSDPSWSPDGKWVAYYFSMRASGWWDENGLHIMNTQCFESPTDCLADEEGRKVSPPYTWSPDSQYLAARGEDTISVFKVENGNLELFRSYSADIDFTYLAWSPSGKWIAVSSGNKVSLVSVSTGEVIPVANMIQFYFWISVP